MQTQTRRVRLQNFLRGIQICHMKADVLAIPKMWWFLILHFFKPKLLLPKVGSNLRIFFWAKWRRNKNKYALNFEFHTSIFNQGGANRYVFRLIEWQNLKGKIVSVFISVTPH